MSREPNVLEPDSDVAHGKLPPTVATAVEGDPMGGLPRLSYRQLRLERLVTEWSQGNRLPPPLRWLEDWCGTAITIDRPEIFWRASGLRRTNLIVQFTATRLHTHLALGIELPMAHAVVDRLLGFDRKLGESRLQLTPVEWGVWSFLILRALDSLDSTPGRDHDEPGPLRPGDLTIDRVGPDPFDPSGLGAIVTVRWSVRLGNVATAVRLWLAESVVQQWLAAPPERTLESLEPTAVPELTEAKRGTLSSTWRAEAGFVVMPQGLKRLRVGGVLPLTGSPLRGTPGSPSGKVDLVLELADQGTRLRIPSSPVADSGGRLIRLEDRPIHEPHVRDSIDVNIREGQSMNQANVSRNPATPVTSTSPTTASASGPLDVPVTLTVELGRVNLTLTQLADIKPGDVIELNRHSRAPVELTSNGRLVARGELVLIDTDLGVRVTSVFL